jgi:cytochrome c oxidase subunit II
MIRAGAPITEQAETIDRVWNLFVGLGLVVLLLVAGLMLWVIVRYRRRTDHGPHHLPPQKHYNIPMEIAYIVIPLLIVLGLFAVTFVTVDAIDDDDPDPDLVVDVIAFQWQWQFDYPDSSVSITGKPGENPELVLPASSTVRFDLTALDVIHSFWIPAFRFKRDMIPGTPGSFSVDVADVAGYYPNTGVCAEFCGLDHSSMRFSVRILPPDEFEQWLSDQPVTGPAPTGTEEDGT